MTEGQQGATGCEQNCLHGQTVNRHHVFSKVAVPEKELNVDDSRGDLLHHVSNEVELVSRTGSM